MADGYRRSRSDTGDAGAQSEPRLPVRSSHCRRSADLAADSGGGPSFASACGTTLPTPPTSSREATIILRANTRDIGRGVAHRAAIGVVSNAVGEATITVSLSERVPLNRVLGTTLLYMAGGTAALGIWRESLGDSLKLTAGKWLAEWLPPTQRWNDSILFDHPRFGFLIVLVVLIVASGLLFKRTPE